MVDAVAPFTGAWIEIVPMIFTFLRVVVAPFTGAWIEIGLPIRPLSGAKSRTLHGCVD